MRVFLTGFMGAGKTTVGRLLAPLLACGFLDLDAEIELQSGQKIAGIFEDLGESEFREMERKCLHAAPDDVVVACGGGCFIYNTEWMLKHGTVVYLRVPFRELAARIGADPSRPLWRNAEQLFRERETVYSRAHLSVDVAEPAAVAESIREAIRALDSR
jgi:shikimate kinase